MTEAAFRNARLVLADAVIEGGLHVIDGCVAAIDAGPGAIGEDFEGDYLIPGLVELHTDQFEAHYRPRPGVYWHTLGALQAHDLQIAGSGITTVFDAVRIGADPEVPGLAAHVDEMVNAIQTGVADGRLKADHLIHLRCELPTPDAGEMFEKLSRLPLVKLASVMDHTPGQRQYQVLDGFIQYYKGKLNLSDAQVDQMIAQRIEDQRRYADANRRSIFARGREAGIAFASHDDATEEQVDEAVRDGVAIAEFPTTLIAAQASHAAGLAVLMGAPNVVRGGSHSGNIAAADLARDGCLDVLSSDYVPGALMLAAFMLPQLVDGMDLPQAIAMVSANPAKAAHLNDRGSLGEAKRADFVRVRLHDGMPVVKGVWRLGQRVG